MAAPLARAWTLNDVSILLPLPKAGEFSLLLSPTSKSIQGELLPWSIYENLPQLIAGVDRRVTYPDLKVIAIRLDPCFRETGPTECQRQIRMVWQPVLASSSESITADAAVHTFYDLSPTEWTNLLQSIQPLTSDDMNVSLDVHPRIRAEGLGGEYWSRLREILLQFAGEKNLTRATSMSVNMMGSIWVFTGFDIEDGVMTRMQIPRQSKVVQGVLVDIDNLSEMFIQVRPDLDAPASWLSLIANSKDSAINMKPEEIKEALRESLRLENPRLTNTANVDCASCHVAQTAHFWGEIRFPKWNSKAEAESYKNQSVNLENRSLRRGFSNRLRAFGYFVDEPVISQRLINESAETLIAIQSVF